MWGKSKKANPTDIAVGLGMVAIASFLSYMLGKKATEDAPKPKAVAAAKE